MAYLPLVLFATVLSWMLFRARAEEQKRGQRSRAGTILLWSAVPIALGIVVLEAASGESVGEAVVSALPLLIFAVIAMIVLATRGDSVA